MLVLLLLAVVAGIGYLVYRVKSKPQEKHRLRVTNSTVVRTGAFDNFARSPNLSRFVRGRESVGSESMLSGPHREYSDESTRNDSIFAMVSLQQPGSFVMDDERGPVFPPEHAGPPSYSSETPYVAFNTPSKK